MKKQLLIVFIIFLSFSCPTFACGCHGGTNSLAASNNQKACKNIISFIFIDFSFLSPKATAADLNVGGKPKLRGHSWMHKCSTPQCCADECDTDECCPTQICPQTCPQQGCTCVPQCPNCKIKSMVPDEGEQRIVTQGIEQDGVIPVSYQQKIEKQTVKQLNKTNMFRIDLFRHFKFQIL